MQSIHRILLTLSWLTFFNISFTPLAFSLEAGLGITALDQGDDRTVPALSLKVAPNQDFIGYTHYHGVTLGPAHLDLLLVSGARRFNVFRSGFLTAQLGASVLLERVVIQYDSSADADHNDSDLSGNIGGNFGIAINMFPASKLMDLSLSWDSHVFPAGIGGIFLANGRKQTITLTMGAHL